VAPIKESEESMRTIIFILVTTAQLTAADLGTVTFTNAQGAVITNARVIRLEPQHAIYQTASGDFGKIPFKSLQSSDQKRFIDILRQDSEQRSAKQRELQDQIAARAQIAAEQSKEQSLVVIDGKTYSKVELEMNVGVIRSNMVLGSRITYRRSYNPPVGDSLSRVGGFVGGRPVGSYSTTEEFGEFVCLKMTPERIKEVKTDMRLKVMAAQIGQYESTNSLGNITRYDQFYEATPYRSELLDKVRPRGK
jgi:hypothetical protein